MCFVCGKPKADHPDGKFCPYQRQNPSGKGDGKPFGTCWVCGKKKEEHADKQFCPPPWKSKEKKE